MQDRKMTFIIALFSGAIFLIWAEYASALPSSLRLFEAKYGYKATCDLCHQKGGGSATNDYGKAFLRSGGNLQAFAKIEKMDSDQDGFANFDEIQAKSNPGDLRSTPANPGGWLAEPGEVPAPEKQPEAATPGPAPPPASLSLGPFSNINLGGTLDYRFIIPTNGDSPSLGIHVNELFLTANIGDNISILAEQLLLTSDLETVVGQDHGFVYGIFTNLPLLPSELALKVGRFRFRYGIDAVSDAPVNPARNLVYKNLGFISDKGLEVTGYYKKFDYAAAVLVGSDFISREVLGPGGLVSGEIKTAVENNSRPVAVRLGYDFPWDLKAGLSFFYGKAYRFVNGPSFDMDDMLTNGTLDRSRLVRKRRASLDLRYGVGKWDFSGEVTVGNEDDGDTEKRSHVSGYYLRVEYSVIPRKLKLLLQYDIWKDGLAQTRDDGVITAGISYNPWDQVTLRLVGYVSEATIANRDNAMRTLMIGQVLLTF